MKYLILSVAMACLNLGVHFLPCTNTIKGAKVESHFKVAKLNQKMKQYLHLTDKQIPILKAINKTYWKTRTNILEKPNKIGRNTAVLACWDDWQRTLYKHLTQEQYHQLLIWQVFVGILSNTPY